MNYRPGRRASSQDEEHGPAKESPPAMQPVGVTQVELQLQIKEHREAMPESSVARSGFVR